VALRDDLITLTPRLRRYARALVAASPHAAAIADDLVHATLLKALETLAHAAQEDALAIAYSFLTDFNREMAQDRRALDATAAGRAFSVGSDPGRGPRRGTVPDSLAEALRRLRLDEREALVLVVVEGLAHGQAARILRISPATLIARLSRARLALANAGMAEPRRTHLRLVQ
jgi:RNA polymerase sigma-70 factor (ECF subfamily)